jgi:hypothetical protein
MQKRPERQRCRAFRVSLAYYFIINPSNDFLHRNKDKIITTFPPNEALDDTLPSRVDDPELDQCAFGQSTDEESADDITEESALDKFNMILQKARRVSEQAEKERRKTCKQPRTYHGKSERTLKRCKQFKDNLAQKGFLSVFDFIAFTKKKTCLPEIEQPQCTAVGSDRVQTNQGLEEDEEEEEENIDDWTSQWINKVCLQKSLRCTD